MTDNTLPKVAFRENIQSAERFMRSEIEAGRMKDALPDCPLTHYFTPISEKYGCAVYGREMLLKAGSLIVGKIHRHAHLNIISMGEVVVNTEHGLKHLRAPCTFISEPGLKRAVVAVVDTIWTTIHLTDRPGEDSLDEIEDEVISPTYIELGLIDETKLLRGES